MEVSNLGLKRNQHLITSSHSLVKRSTPHHLTQSIYISHKTDCQEKMIIIIQLKLLLTTIKLNRNHNYFEKKIHREILYLKTTIETYKK